MVVDTALLEAASNVIPPCWRVEWVVATKRLGYHGQTTTIFTDRAKAVSLYHADLAGGHSTRLQAIITVAQHKEEDLNAY